MTLNKEEYLLLTECSKQLNIKTTILHSWIKKGHISYKIIGKNFYIKTSSITNMTEIIGSCEVLLAEEKRLKENISRAKKIETEIITFSKPQINEQAVADAFHIYINSMEGLIGPGGSILSSLVSGESLVSLSMQSGKSLGELTADLKVAISRLRLYRLDIPILRKRLAETLVSNQSLKLENKLLREKLKTTTSVTDYKSASDEHLWDILSTPLASFPLSVRTINATREGQLITLFDVIVANKACGMAGLCHKLSNFGKRSYKEIESLLIDKKLVSILPSGQWSSSADWLINKSNLIFIKYQSSVSPQHPLVKRGRQEKTI